MSQSMEPTILLIEADASLRRLIVLGLQYRGMSVVEASSPTALPLVELQQPSVLVLDVDGNVKSNWSLLHAIQSHPLLSHLPMIILTWDFPLAAPSAQDVPGEMDSLASQPHITYLTKPFDARTLYASIEQILLSQTVSAASPMETVATATLPEAAQLPVRYATSSAPSMYPMITAAGLLLAFIGLMGIFALTFLGLAIVLVSLLAWTLGSGSQTELQPLIRANT